MAVQVWSVGEYLDKAREFGAKEFPSRTDLSLEEWIASVTALGERAHARGDGVAIYTNEDLGHPQIGEWQVMSYGSDTSQLETRHPVRPAFKNQVFIHGQDAVPVRLPDIGGAINWRYQLFAVVPSYSQLELAEAAAKRIQVEVPHLVAQHGYDRFYVDTLSPDQQAAEHDRLHADETAANLDHNHIGEAFNDPRVPCCGRDAADCDCVTTLTLGTPELLELRRVWCTGDDALLQRRIVSLVRDIFEGRDGDLHKLADIKPDGPDSSEFFEEGWWHPNAVSGKVHLHPDHVTAYHRLCEPVYSKRRRG